MVTKSRAKRMFCYKRIGLSKSLNIPEKKKILFGCTYICCVACPLNVYTFIIIFIYIKFAV